MKDDKHNWTELDRIDSRKEGWYLSRLYTGLVLIYRTEPDHFTFSSHEQAEAHVWTMADRGSDLHERALAIVLRSKMENPNG